MSGRGICHNFLNLRKCRHDSEASLIRDWSDYATFVNAGVSYAAGMAETGASVNVEWGGAEQYESYMSSSRCKYEVHEVQNESATPPLDARFASEPKSTAAELGRLMDRYGTHAIIKTEAGGEIVYVSTVRRCSQHSEADGRFSADGLHLQWTRGGSIEVSAMKGGGSAVESITVRRRGGSSSDGWSSWEASLTDENMALIGVELYPIKLLLPVVTWPLWDAEMAKRQADARDRAPSPSPPWTCLDVAFTRASVGWVVWLACMLQAPGMVG